jgi:hypothetical protein
MPVISLRFTIIGIITDTTGITIIIVITIIITTSDLALPTRELTRRIRSYLQFGQLKFVEKTMQRIGLTLTAAVAVIAGGTVADRLQAAPIGHPEGLRAALGSLDIIEKAQVFVWQGRRYCWYDDGWHGPGFYWCGYARRHGLGWGGGSGWHGWQRGVQPEGGKPEGRKSEGRKSHGAQPEGAKPEGRKPEGAQPQGGKPEGGKPQGAQPQGGKSEGAQPQGGKPEGGQPKGGESQGGQNK